jgi:hypothetical protein
MISLGAQNVDGQHDRLRARSHVQRALVLLTTPAGPHATLCRVRLRQVDGSRRVSHWPRNVLGLFGCKELEEFRERAQHAEGDEYKGDDQGSAGLERAVAVHEM